MASDGDAFLKRKFMHLFKCFEHSRKGFIVKEDADIHCKQLESILRGQLEREGLTNDAIEKRILDFRMDWLPSAMGYFGELSKFAQNNEEISKEDFMAFNMSIRDHIAQHDALPLWFDNSLRMSYAKCWSSKNGLLFEDGLELLPGVTKDSKTSCLQHLTDNNNTKINASVFLDHIKNFYSNEDPTHVSKYIHGYEEE